MFKARKRITYTPLDAKSNNDFIATHVQWRGWRLATSAQNRQNGQRIIKGLPLGKS
jgi:hypothetical protein